MVEFDKHMVVTTNKSRVNTGYVRYPFTQHAWVAEYLPNLNVFTNKDKVWKPTEDTLLPLNVYSK